VISVLYVDDEPDLLEIGRLFLERTGLFSVDTVDSAPEALRVIAEKRYDAIISDYQMPEMDGIELLKRVRASGTTVPFIIFTGRGREEIVIQALNEGADFYLQKGGEPVSQFTELAHKVQTAVQQRRTEASIRDHERREADIINFLPDATFAIDSTGHVITWNHAIEEMTGVSASEMLGKGQYEYAIPFYGQRQPILIDLISESDEVIAKKYSHIIHEKDVLIAETTLPHPKGNSVILMGKASPLYNRQGEIIGAIESIRDITKIRQAEKSLRESEQKYRTVFETTGTATVMIEDDATISLANSEFERLSGYRKDEIEYEKKWTDFVVSEDLDPMLAQHRLRRQDRLNALTHYEFRFMPRSKDIRDIYLTIDVIPGTGKSVASLLDITTRKQAESELRAAYEQLTATEEELRRQYRDLAEKEQKLRQSEARYRNVVEVQTELISRFLPDGTHVFVNEAYCRYFGKSREEIIGHIFIPGIPGDDQEALKIHFSSLTPSQPVKSIEHRIIMADGEIRWQRWNDRAIFDEKGNITEFQSVGRDITDRIEAEEALRESEEQFRKIFENSPIGMALSTPNFRFISVNPAMVSITGYTQEELLQLSFKDITHPDHLGGDMEYIQELAEEKIPVYATEKRYIRKDGSIIWGLLKVTTIRDQQGILRYFAAQIEDITERKKVEAALRDSEERYRQLVEQSPDAIIVHTSGKIVYANPACIRLFGAQGSGDLVGQPVLNFVHPDFRHTVIDRVRVMTEKKDPVALLEEKFLRLDGTSVDVDVAAIPIVFENLPSVQVTFRDISGRRQVEDELRRAYRMLKLLSSITRHDINNQITLLIGFLRILEKKQTDPSLSEQFQKISTTAKRISDMIHFTGEYEKIGVNAPLWQEIRSLTGTAAGGALPGKIVVKNDVPAGAEVFADPLIVKVFYTLIENAVRHGQKISEIRFTVQGSGENCLIIYEDDGEGVPAKEKERIFEQGFGKNTGIGLFLAREILSTTGITIHETGEPGKGARFEIMIPQGAYRVVGGK